jgi:hypothetical protein
VIAWLCKVLSSDRSGVPFRICSHTNPREQEGAVKPETADKRFTVHDRKVTRNGNIGSKSFIYQQMHFISVLENIKICIKTFIKIASTCFGLRPSSGSLHMSLAKVTFIKSVKVRRYGLCGCLAACYIKWCVCCVLCRVKLSSVSLCTADKMHIQHTQ